jgi:hypothetical protein
MDVNVGNPFLAQSVTTMGNLETAIGHGLGIIIVIAYAYAVVMIIMSLIQERGDGSWKYSLAKGIALFASTGIVQILCTIFFPGLVITPSFA